MAPQPQVKYHIINAKSGTVLDLSGTNQTTISGWQNNGGDNQEWYTEEVAAEPGSGLFAIKDVHYGKFASFYGTVREGAPVVGLVERRGLWQIREVGPELYSFSVVDSPFVLELSQDGDKANGTPVVIARERGIEAQKWRLVPVAAKVVKLKLMDVIWNRVVKKFHLG